MITTFHRPQTIEEAVTLRTSLGQQACFLAGGTNVNSSDSKFTGDTVIDLTRLGLDNINTTSAEITVGACCTITQLLEATGIPSPVKAAARNIASRNIRNIATVGGHIATNKSCGDLLPVLIALEALLDTIGPNGAARVPILDYLSAGDTNPEPLDPAARPLITHIRIPSPSGNRAVAVDHYSRTVNDVSILTVAVALTKDGHLIRNPIVAAGGLAKHVIRLSDLEQKLADIELPSQDKIEGWTKEEISPVSDIRGSADFKRYRAGVLIAMAIQSACLGQKGGQS